MYPLIFISRRFLLVVVTTVTHDKLFVQLIYMQTLSFLQVAYLASYKPFEEPLILKLEIFNEVTTVLLVDLLTIFSEGNPFKPASMMDMFFLVCLGSNICVHLYFLIKTSVVSIQVSCRRRKRECRPCCGCLCPQQKAQIKTKKAMAYAVSTPERTKDYLKPRKRAARLNDSESLPMKAKRHTRGLSSIVESFKEEDSFA